MEMKMTDKQITRERWLAKLPPYPQKEAITPSEKDTQKGRMKTLLCDFCGWKGYVTSTNMNLIDFDKALCPACEEDGGLTIIKK